MPTSISIGALQEEVEIEERRGGRNNQMRQFKNEAKLCRFAFLRDVERDSV